MKKNSILMFAFLIIVNFGVQTASAQNSPEAPSDHLVNHYVNEIKEVQDEVDRFKPEYGALVYTQKAENYVLNAISKRVRDEQSKSGFIGVDSEWRQANPGNKIDAALNALAASVAKKLPTYKADLSIYKVRNAAEEKLMKGIFRDITAYQIYSVGLAQSNWLIAKNNYGIPTARYKNGAFYLRDKNSDHPYCFLSYVNIIQTYAGGGTYGASYANFIRDELVGCPEGAK